RGFRIEPAEIAWAVERLQGVRQCAVVARGEERSGSTRLVAYVVLETRADADPDRLRVAARHELPAHLVPHDFVFVDALPLSPSGRLAGRALPPPPMRARPAAPPRNATAEIVAGVMADVLGVEEVGAQEHFFDLGGHSLLGLELLARLSRVLAVDIPVPALLENPTAAELAAIVEEKWIRAGDKRSSLPETARSLVRIKPGGSKQPLFFPPGGDGGGGALLVYARLARFIDQDRPFFGLRRCDDNGAMAHHSVEEMAAAYLAEVKQVQPRGP